MIPIPEDLREAIKTLNKQIEVDLNNGVSPTIEDFNKATDTIRKYAKIMRDEGI